MQALASAVSNHDWIAQAPMALVVCTHAARCEYDNKEHWALQDAASPRHWRIWQLWRWAGDLLGRRVCCGKVAEVIERRRERFPLRAAVWLRE